MSKGIWSHLVALFRLFIFLKKNADSNLSVILTAPTSNDAWPGKLLLLSFFSLVFLASIFLDLLNLRSVNKALSDFTILNYIEHFKNETEFYA